MEIVAKHKPKKIEDLYQSIEISFSVEEAKILFLLLGQIGGHGPLRELSDKIYEHLEDLGFSYDADQEMRFMDPDSSIISRG